MSAVRPRPATTASGVQPSGGSLLTGAKLRGETVAVDSKICRTRLPSVCGTLAGGMRFPFACRRIRKMRPQSATYPADWGRFRSRPQPGTNGDDEVAKAKK